MHLRLHNCAYSCDGCVSTFNCMVNGATNELQSDIPVGPTLERALGLATQPSTHSDLLMDIIPDIQLTFDDLSTFLIV